MLTQMRWRENTKTFTAKTDHSYSWLHVPTFYSICWTVPSLHLSQQRSDMHTVDRLFWSTFEFEIIGLKQSSNQLIGRRMEAPFENRSLAAFILLSTCMIFSRHTARRTKWTKVQERVHAVPQCMKIEIILCDVRLPLVIGGDINC